MRYTGPKMKLVRREGINLFGTQKYNLDESHRTPLRSRQSSEYGIQLRKKQTAKRMFGLSEKQFFSYYKKALKTKGEGTTGDKMLRMIELRVDNIVYRSNFARTRIQARQFVSHAHFTLNGVKIDVPSISVKVGDELALRDKMKESPLYKGLIEEFAEFAKQNKGNVTSAKWLEVDTKNLKITIKALPETQDFEQIVDVQKIIEFYSR